MMQWLSAAGRAGVGRSNGPVRCWCCQRLSPHRPLKLRPSTVHSVIVLEDDDVAHLRHGSCAIFNAKVRPVLQAVGDPPAWAPCRAEPTAKGVGGGARAWSA